MKKFLNLILAGGMALGLVLTGTGCADGTENSSNGEKTETSYAFLAIDINPSVEMVVSGSEVESVRAANDDAGVLLSGEELTGLSVEQASYKITYLAEQMGYLNEDNSAVKINVVADDEDYESEIIGEAAEGVQSASEIAQVNAESRASDERTLESLKEQDPELYKNLTFAKLRLIETIMQYDGTMTYEKGANMSVGELLGIWKAYAEEYKDLVCGELKNAFEEKLTAAVEDAERRIAAVYGEEYLAAWENYNAIEKAVGIIEERAEMKILTDDDIKTVAELLQIDDVELISSNGEVTAESVEHYLDKVYGQNLSDKSMKEQFKQTERAVERILDGYDEENYALTDEDLTLIYQACTDAPELVTFGDAEEFLKQCERELDVLRNSIRLTAEQREEILAIKSGLTDLKQTIREEMRDDIEEAQEEIRSQKQELISAWIAERENYRHQNDGNLDGTVAE